MGMASVLPISCGSSAVETVVVLRGCCEDRWRWEVDDEVEVDLLTQRRLGWRLVVRIFVGELLDFQLRFLLPLTGCLMQLLQDRLQMATWK